MILRAADAVLLTLRVRALCALPAVTAMHAPQPASWPARTPHAPREGLCPGLPPRPCAPQPASWPARTPHAPREGPLCPACRHGHAAPQPASWPARTPHASREGPLCPACRHGHAHRNPQAGPPVLLTLRVRALCALPAVTAMRAPQPASWPARTPHAPREGPLARLAATAMRTATRKLALTRSVRSTASPGG